MDNLLARLSLRRMGKPMSAELWVSEDEAAGLVAIAVERGVLQPGSTVLPLDFHLWGHQIMVVQGRAEG